jgi:hypothetical protein
MKTTMVWKTVGSVLVVRESADSPSDEEWDGLMAALTSQRQRSGDLRVIVVTDGGGPTSTQRGRIKAAVQSAAIRSAVVSDSIKIRFIASAVMLVSKNHACFSKREIQGAYNHLKLTPEERLAVGETLKQIEQELNPGPLRA